MFLICSASRIWSFCLLFWCSNIGVLLVRIFRSCVVEHECFFKCWAIELVSESTRDTYNDRQYINQFTLNTIKVKREFERIQKKICRHKMSIMFNEICINEEMLPKYTHIYIYIYIYMLKRYICCESDSMIKISRNQTLYSDLDVWYFIFRNFFKTETVFWVFLFFLIVYLLALPHPKNTPDMTK